MTFLDGGISCTYLCAQIQKGGRTQKTHAGWESHPNPQADGKKHFTIDNYLYQSSYLQFPRLNKNQ